MRKIICIGRDYGSRGHEIAPDLSQALGIPYYDKALLDKAVEISEIPKEVLSGAEEQATNPWVFSMIYQGNSSEYFGRSANDVLYDLEKNIILETAAKEDCIFIGRCADDILKEEGKYQVISIFITAPMGYRVRAVMNKDGLTERQATVKINKHDRARRAYYDHYTGKSWGDAASYDITLNMESLGKEKVISIIKDLYENV